jgi:two-component system chemotaxis response regulator CheB
MKSNYNPNRRKKNRTDEGECEKAMKSNPSNNGSAVRILIVDDAPLMRKAIQEIIGKDGKIEVVGTAINGQDCIEKVPKLKPDVVTLDIDMPVMNGITAIKNIMVRHQTPIVIVSSLIEDGYFAFEALRLGVVDFVPKPSRIVSGAWGDEEEILRQRVRAASGIKIHRMRRVRRLKRSNSSPASNGKSPTAVVVMGTTLAGPNTVMHIVTQLPPDFAGAIIAVQEIHPRILAPFCSSFNEMSPLEVIPVTSPCKLRQSKVYLASTFNGLRIEGDQANPDELVLIPEQTSEAPIDQLFESAAHLFRDRACAVLLTGVGTDGAEGMREIKKHGGLTIGQNQDCSVFPNLVDNAIQQNVVDVLMTNHGIAGRLETWARG